MPSLFVVVAVVVAAGTNNSVFHFTQNFSYSPAIQDSSLLAFYLVAK
jgi:hypothetical protein